MKPIELYLRKYQQLVFSTVLIAVSVIGLIVGVWPLAQRTLTLQKINANLSKEVKALEEKSSLLASMDEESLRTQLLTLASAVPPDKSPATVFSGVDGVVSQTGVSMIDFTLVSVGSLATESAKKLTEEEKRIGANLLPLTLSVEGTMEGVQKFLSSIVSVRRFFHLRSADITVSEKITAHISLDTFYSPFPTTVGTIVSPITSLTSDEEETIAEVSAIPLFAPPAVEITAQAPASVKPDPFNP